MSVFNRDKVKAILKPIVENAYKDQQTEKDIYSNTLDCFSAVIDSSVRGVTLEEWKELEKQRQAQKALQNKIGDFHQQVLGTLDGIDDLGTGGVVDLVSSDHKMVAEIKNKWNTTKGNHKKNIYDDLESVLGDKEKEGYVGFYVEMLPKNGQQYNDPFVPSDNTSSTKRESRDDIRVIDGKTFYTKITGDENALEELYSLVPELTAEILEDSFKVKRNAADVKDNEVFPELYNKIFPKTPDV